MADTDSVADDLSVSGSYVVTNISVGIGLLTVLLTVLYFWLRKRESPCTSNVGSAASKLRFRKREKIMFYGCLLYTSPSPRDS